MVLPYLKGFLYSCVHVMVNGLWFILGLIEVYLQICYRYLTIGIRALSLVDIVGKYFLILQIFFREEKKRATTFRKNSVYFYAKFAEKCCIFELFSKKYPSLKNNSSETESMKSRY
jgi:hypothetical protein